jgi:hypothetical protein
MAVRRIALLAAAGVFFCAATAKEFGPGDLRVCGAKRCVPIEKRDELRAFSSFYYGDGRAAVTRKPRLGAPAFEIRFRDGSAAGIVASAKLDRARVYGLNCGRFRRGRWYRLPARAVLAVRPLSASLTPLRVTRRAPPRSC